MQYTLVRSKRKTLCVQIVSDAQIVVRAPYSCGLDTVERFLRENEERISAAVERAKGRAERLACRAVSEEDIPAVRESARLDLTERTAFWAEKMGVEPSGIKITSAKKRYGSCNSKRGICYSYMLMAFEPYVRDYVVVHELAHIKHMNHSPQFYRLVAQFIPDYAECEKILKGEA